MKICEEKSGFLFTTPCKKPAEFTCAHCSKAICSDHTYRQQLENLCITCARKRANERDDLEDAHPLLSRDRYYRNYGYYSGDLWLDTEFDDYDFTEADGMSFEEEGFDSFESDMAGS